ncbi:hypothetical protein IP90_01212 [Luteimonas cucumeris]|uniref:Uncharacterized protein n=1 Tax=Luteimonas cucumeris TaxID=985012 RepID=A0A562L711_9GAMM|nr:hypothetical protein [Luteimonas cucumeris]TWI03411.1 hypothetical protein IP90_01212 [Luteimonas cucumeris]
MKTLISLALLLGFTSAAHAQEAGPCPQLPGSQLSWEQRSYGDSILCRAIRSDGSEAFGVSIANEEPYELRRSNRRGQGSVNGQGVYWHEGELAARPGMLVRETMFELANGRNVHVWIHADSDAQLRETTGIVQGLHFDPDRLSSK